jgi:hypothetical protein
MCSVSGFEWRNVHIAQYEIQNGMYRRGRCMPQDLLHTDPELTLILVTPKSVGTFLHHACHAVLYLLCTKAVPLAVRRGGSMPLQLATFGNLASSARYSASPVWQFFPVITPYFNYISSSLWDFELTRRSSKRGRERRCHSRSEKETERGSPNSRLWVEGIALGNMYPANPNHM